MILFLLETKLILIIPLPHKPMVMVMVFAPKLTNGF